MRRRALLAAVLLLAAFAAWLLLRDRAGPAAGDAAGEGTPSPRAEPGEAAPAGLAARTPAPVAAPREPVYGASPAPKPGRRRLRLLARVASDAAPSAVEFTAAWRRQEWNGADVTEPIPLVATKPREAWGDLGTTRGAIRVRARTVDGSLGSRPNFQVPAYTIEPELVEAMVDLYPAGRMVGRIQDPSGNAVVGARILVEPGFGALEVPPTDAEGGYRIEAIAGSVSFRVEAEGFAPSPVVGARVPPGGETNLGVVLESAWTLVGRAADEGGRPLSGTLRAGHEEVALGEGGAFRFVRQPIPDVDRVGLRWSDEDRAWATGAAMLPDRAARGPTVDVGEVRFRLLRRVDLTLESARGEPIAWVMVGGLDPATKQLAWGRITDHEGRVTTEAPAGTWALGATDLSLIGSPTVVVGPVGPREPLRLVAEDAVRIDGRVSYEGKDSPPWRDYVTVAVRGGVSRCDADGRFRVWIPRSSVGAPVFVHAGTQRFERGVAADDGRPLDLRLSPKDVMGFRLRVVRKDGTTPVPMYDLTVSKADHSSGGHTGTVQVATGEETIWPFEPAKYRVTARPWDGGAPATVDADLTGPAWPDVVIRLDR